MTHFTHNGLITFSLFVIIFQFVNLYECNAQEILTEITEAHTRVLYNCDDFTFACRSLQSMAYSICMNCSIYLSATDCTSTTLYKQCAYNLMCSQQYKPEYTCPSNGSTSGLPGGAIIGIAVGSTVIGVMIIGCLIYKFRNRMRISLQQQMAMKQQYQTPGPIQGPIQKGPIQPQYYPQFGFKGQYPPQAFQQSPMPYNGQQQYMVVGQPLFR